MELSPLQQQALTLWHDLGDTTPTHPVLQMAYELYYAPFGVVCDALRYDALAALGNRDSATLNFINPRFDPKRVNRDWPQFSIVAPLLEVSDLLSPTFAPDGTLTEFTYLKDFSFADENNSMASTFVQSAEHKKVQDFEKNHAAALFDLSDALAATAKLFIDASLELMIQPDKISSDFAELFVKNPRHYGAVAFQVFTKDGPGAQA